MRGAGSGMTERDPWAMARRDQAGHFLSVGAGGLCGRGHREAQGVEPHPSPRVTALQRPSKEGSCPPDKAGLLCALRGPPEHSRSARGCHCPWGSAWREVDTTSPRGPRCPQVAPKGLLRKTQSWERPAQSLSPQRRGLHSQQTNGSLLGFSYLVVLSLVSSSSFWMT